MQLSAVVRELIAAGLSGEMLVAAIERIEGASSMVPSAGALRTRAWRERKKQQAEECVTVTSRDVCDDVSSPPVPPPSSPLTNPLITPPISPPSKQTRAKPAKNGAFLPDDWMPDPEDQQFAVTLLGNPDAANWEWQKFRDYWRGKPGAAGRKSDWGMTWRNWIRRASENQRGRGPPGKNQLGGHELAAELRRQIDEATSAEFGSVEGSCEVGYDFGFDPGRR